MIFTGGPDVQPQRVEQPVEIVPGSAKSDEQIRGRAKSHIMGSSDSSDQGNTELLEHSTSELQPHADLQSSELVYQVSQTIARTIDTDQLLRSVLDLIFQWIACDRGCILLMDERTSELLPACCQRRTPHNQGSAQTLEISRTILEHVMQQQEGVLTSNAQQDSRWDNAASIISLGIREAICVPLQGRYGVLGAIYIDTESPEGRIVNQPNTRKFDETHLRLLITIAGQAALALEDTQFYHAMLQSERLAAIGQTIANLSHHVKNILQGLGGGSFQLEDGLKKENWATVQRGWEIVKRNQDRIGTLVMDMLSFSKERQPVIELRDVCQTICEVAELSQPRAKDLGVDLDVPLPDQPVVAQMDCEAIHRALLNVVANAIDAASTITHERSEPGRVIVSLEHDIQQRQIRIIVQDNGDGVQPQELSKIFAPFHSSKGASGTGLGLPVSQKIMREHGGDIILDSQPGHGAKFTLFWPMDGLDSSTILPG
jgi:signal transduction histidine kinase